MLQVRKLFTLGLMARSLGVTAGWLRSEVDAKRLPAVLAEKQILFDPETVERLLLERARNTQEPPG